ncbi:replication-relaxation family protein [Mycobacteroides abscessus]|uniref:replication-relaxation family protein n=1 Tax=Mycobacteroides abscessus TaxID=36809 RepID=UPI000C25FE40|nr:replication-relaxation family protein [Mycobacteroides abscessus]
MQTRVLTDSQLAANALRRYTGITGLTRGDKPPPRAVQWITLHHMRLVARQWRVLNHIRHFQQLRTSQIYRLEFHDTTRTPCDRTLKRLRDLGLIEVVRERLPGGDRGGSSEHVLQLSAAGYKHFPGDKARRNTTIRYHALVVADVYIAALEASRDGWLDILDKQVEVDAWANVAGADIRPDLYLDLGLREQRKRYRLNIEVDLGRERQKQIVEKLERYVYAAQHAAQYPDGQSRQTLFLVTDDERLRELRRIVKRFNAPDGLVMVEMVEDFPSYLR